MTDSAPVTTAELDQLVARDHHDPHAILGAHTSADGVTIRALHPAAEAVVVLPEGVELDRVHPAGLFEGELRGASLPHEYELEVRYPDGGTWVTQDPYRFAPTLSDMDEHLFREGRHEQLWSKMGAHPRELDGVRGTSFAVWAPAARSVSVVGDFNFWDGRLHMMRTLGGSGIWELFVPAVGDGARYKFEIRAQSGELLLKADPFAFQTEPPPQTSSIVHESTYEWNDADYLVARAAAKPHERPMAVYEVHLGSWRRNPLEDNRSLTYLELADELSAYVTDLGFTHIELMPVMAHPFSGSWG
ncbi:MAG: 1,4-alpha-glucan branching enzyme, partial [Actinobacteria bacterium]|nr:1,4-alpha-glucan branching enzyme [Actinomycetota bacterium]